MSFTDKLKLHDIHHFKQKKSLARLLTST